MKIPQVSPWLGEEELTEVNNVFKNNWLTEGPYATIFSKSLNDFFDVEYGVFAPNGTLALFLGLLALEIGYGDEVIVPDCTFIGSANAVVLTGATPVFVDVNRDNFQIDVKLAENLITSKTKAIMPVHLYGMSANMKEVIDFAKRWNLKIIEDAAQGVGVKYYDKHVGTFGDVGCFSFFADKTITTGEGGYVVAKNKEIFEKLLLLRNQGRYDRGSFIHPAIGYNFRITDIQAAVGVVQLRKFAAIQQNKTRIYELYYEELKDTPEVEFLKVEEGSNHVPFRAVLLVQDAQKLMSYLDERIVQTRSFFYPLHKQPCFKSFHGNNGGIKSLDDKYFPNSIYGYEHGLCLPIYPSLQDDQIKEICRYIKGYFHD